MWKGLAAGWGERRLHGPPAEGVDVEQNDFLVLPGEIAERVGRELPVALGAKELLERAGDVGEAIAVVERGSGMVTEAGVLDSLEGVLVEHSARLYRNR